MSDLKPKLQVEAIERGTVIDHIPAGQGLKIVNRLQLLNNQVRLTVGFNFGINASRLKDLIKVDDWLIGTSVAVAQLVGAQASGQPHQLVTQTNSHHRKAYTDSRGKSLSRSSSSA